MSVFVHELEVVGSGIAKGFKFVVNLEEKVVKFLKLVKLVQEPIFTEIKTLFTDLEAFIAESSAVIEEKGLNLAADSAAFAGFMKLRTDVVQIAATLKSITDAAAE